MQRPPTPLPAHAYAPALPRGLMLVLRFLMSLFAGIGVPLPPDTISRVRLRRSDTDSDAYVLLLEAATRSMRADLRRAGKSRRARRQRLQRSGHAEIIPTPADQSTAPPAHPPAARGPIARRSLARPPWPPPRPKPAVTRQRLFVPI